MLEEKEGAKAIYGRAIARHFAVPERLNILPPLGRYCVLLRKKEGPLASLSLAVGGALSAFSPLGIYCGPEGAKGNILPAPLTARALWAYIAESNILPGPSDSPLRGNYMMLLSYPEGAYICPKGRLASPKGSARKKQRDSETARDREEKPFRQLCAKGPSGRQLCARSGPELSDREAALWPFTVSPSARRVTESGPLALYSEGQRCNICPPSGVSLCPTIYAQRALRPQRQRGPFGHI